jgi:hypothetical protein
MSWKPMVKTAGPEWAGNALAFATKEEAEMWARDLMMRWTLVTDYCARESDEAVNYAIRDGVVHSLEREKVLDNG